MLRQLHPGERLDDYLLGNVAARSGMASIFRATDTRTGQAVAVKVPHPEMECDPAFFDRFRREEEIGKDLDHPGVVKVFANEGRSRVYMVMEWVEGKLLRELLSGHRAFTADRAVRIALQILDALEYIHSRGVVHRDLKPENIMVDAGDRIKLIDFGIASKIGLRRLTFRGFTKMMGTPDYISPEQVDGKRGDARSDIYSVGIIFYEMLTGRTPFQGSTALEVMNDRVRNHPIPPREVDPGISPVLQEITYRALERDPRNRYGNAREMAWDLEHQDRVAAPDRNELQDWKWRKTPLGKRILLYCGLAAIPAVIFSLLILVARSV